MCIFIQVVFIMISAGPLAQNAYSVQTCWSDNPYTNVLNMPWRLRFWVLEHNPLRGGRDVFRKLHAHLCARNVSKHDQISYSIAARLDSHGSLTLCTSGWDATKLGFDVVKWASAAHEPRTLETKYVPTFSGVSACSCHEAAGCCPQAACSQDFTWGRWLRGVT